MSQAWWFPTSAVPGATFVRRAWPPVWPAVRFTSPGKSRGHARLGCIASRAPRRRTPSLGTSPRRSPATKASSARLPAAPPTAPALVLWGAIALLLATQESCAQNATCVGLIPPTPSPSHVLQVRSIPGPANGTAPFAWRAGSVRTVACGCLSRAPAATSAAAAVRPGRRACAQQGSCATRAWPQPSSRSSASRRPSTSAWIPA
mmetsp:Transcript_75106/g.179286  ORF Transcript_75106/g.179286 Transcript_75106/m.179286 type:complete len:204 (+) Transcript_75106:4212-4823(+)